MKLYSENVGCPCQYDMSSIFDILKKIIWQVNLQVYSKIKLVVLKEKIELNEIFFVQILLCR